MTRPDVTRTAVVSPVIASVAYSSQATLDVAFRRGAHYRYFAVPASVVQGLLAAPSKGAYFNRHIRHHFRYHRLA